MGEGISSTPFHDLSLYPLARDGSNSFPTTRSAPFSQPRRHFPAQRVWIPPHPSDYTSAVRTPPPALKKPVRIVASSRLKQIYPHGRRTRWWLCGEPQTREDASDGGRLLDGRNELQLPTTVRAVLDVDIEHPRQQLRPPHAPLRAPDRRVVAIARVCWCARRRQHRHHGLAQLRIRCQHPMKADQAYRGRGTRAARRCMNSIGAITWWLVPSRHAVFRFSTTYPARSTLSRSLAIAGPVM